MILSHSIRSPFDYTDESSVASEKTFFSIKNILEKMFYAIILGDWTSYYLALLNNQDPTPVAMVEEFKKELNKK